MVKYHRWREWSNPCPPSLKDVPCHLSQFTSSFFNHFFTSFTTFSLICMMYCVLFDNLEFSDLIARIIYLTATGNHLSVKKAIIYWQSWVLLQGEICRRVRNERVAVPCALEMRLCWGPLDAPQVVPSALVPIISTPRARRSEFDLTARYSRVALREVRSLYGWTAHSKDHMQRDESGALSSS